MKKALLYLFGTPFIGFILFLCLFYLSRETVTDNNTISTTTLLLLLPFTLLSFLVGVILAIITYEV